MTALEELLARAGALADRIVDLHSDPHREGGCLGLEPDGDEPPCLVCLAGEVLKLVVRIRPTGQLTADAFDELLAGDVAALEHPQVEALFRSMERNLEREHTIRVLEEASRAYRARVDPELVLVGFEGLARLAGAGEDIERGRWLDLEEPGERLAETKIAVRANQLPRALDLRVAGTYRVRVFIQPHRPGGPA